MKKFWYKLKIFFNSFFWGLRSADDELTTSTKDATGEGSTITQKQEQKSVYADLLKGEVTQEVKELRHEMYYAERRSHDYIYNGGGHAAKLNKVFDYEGKIENSDGHRVELVQDNEQDAASYEDYGIDIDKKGEDYSTIKMEDIASKSYRIKIKRDFVPRFKLEEYTKKVVVKAFEDNKKILDIYVSKYEIPFDRRSRIFVNAVESIYMGDIRSEIIDFQGLAFITKNAYGADDLIFYEFSDFEFKDIIDFDGNYVIRFLCTCLSSGEDLIEEFYDETAAKKSEEHAPREGATIDVATAQEIIDRDSYDVDTAKKLIEELGDE